MQSVTFKCVLLTPLFMSGAYQGKWEIRSQSVKGMMAFWWRTMNAHLPLKDSEEKNEDGFPLVEGLKTKEGALFGDTSQKSKFKIRIISQNVPKKKIEGFEENDFRIQDSGLKYLFFSIKERIGVPPTFDEKNPIAFELKLSSKNPVSLKKAIACFWLTANLGGLGNRSRRGGGNLYAYPSETSSSIILDTNLKFEPQRDQSIKNYLETNLKVIRSIVQEESATGPDPITKNLFSNFEKSEIIVSKMIKKYPSQALNAIGSIYKDFRQRNDLTGSTQNIIKKAPFGLPIVHRDRINIQPEQHTRRSSPLIFRVVRKSEGMYFWIVTKLSGEILPFGEGVIDKNNGTEPVLPDDLILDSFLDEIENDKTELIQL